MPHLALMAKTRTSWSRLILLKIAQEVTQVLLRLHTFSLSSGILLHTPQTHHPSSLLYGSDSSGSSRTLVKFLDKSTLPQLSKHGQEACSSFLLKVLLQNPIEGKEGEWRPEVIRLFSVFLMVIKSTLISADLPDLSLISPIPTGHFLCTASAIFTTS